MPNADGKGCQINLDNGEGRIIAGYVVDDIRAISSYLDITFESPKKLLFGADNHYYFTYLKIDWVPVSFDENTGLNKTWHYSIRALPKPLYEYITKPCKNTSELARALKLNLSELSVNLDLPCPIINQYAGNIIQANRFYSLEKAYNDRQLNKAVFIYLNSRELYSATWRSLTSQTAVALTFPEGTEGTNLITYQDYQFENVFNTAHGCNVWKQKDYLGKMLGTQFKVNTTVPAVCLNTYTIKSEEIPDFDTGLSFLCTYSKRDIMEVNAFTHCFTNINYM
jgi:hypothetical protein